MANVRRVTIDLPDETSDEIERIRASTGMTIADIFRHSFTLLRLYLEAKAEKKELRIIDPKSREQVRIELPTIQRRKTTTDKPVSLANS